MADAAEMYRAYDPNRQGWKAPPSEYRPDVSALLSSNDDPGRVIAALVAESNELAKPQEPTVWDSLTTLAPTHRRKLPGRALADAQRQHFMDRALEIYGRPTSQWQSGEYMRPSKWSSLPDNLQSDMMSYATNKDGFRDNIAKPYEYTGWLGPGSRLMTAAKWVQALPSGVYQGSHALANLSGDVTQGYAEGDFKTSGDPGHVKSYRQAYEDAADAGGTLLAPVTSALGMDAVAPTQWSRMQAARERLDENPHAWLGGGLTHFDNRPYQKAAQSVEANAGSAEDGESLLMDYKVDELIGKTGTRILGAVMDDTLNPFWDGQAITKAARAGKMGPAWRGLAWEHFPGAALAGYASYRENELEKMINRLEAAKDGR